MEQLLSSVRTCLLLTNNHDVTPHISSNGRLQCYKWAEHSQGLCRIQCFSMKTKFNNFQNRESCQKGILDLEQ